jgi:signal transduction histidine kinase
MYTPTVGHIEVALALLPLSYRISVPDKGLGRSPDSAGAIFRMFEQVEVHGKHADEGL